MKYTLPQRNKIVTEIGDLEAKLGLVFSPTHNTPTAELEAKRDDLQAQLDLTNACTNCRNCGC